MPHRMVGILSLLLVFALEMRAQGEVVLSIDGEPVKRSEFEYYFRKSSHRTPLSFLPSFINYKLKVRYAHDMGIDTLSVFRRQVDWYRGKLLRTYLADAEKEDLNIPFVIVGFQYRTGRLDVPVCQPFGTTLGPTEH